MNPISISGAGNMVNSWDLYARSENTQRVSLPEGLETLLPVDKVEFLQGLMGAWFEQGSLEYDFMVRFDKKWTKK